MQRRTLLRIAKKLPRIGPGWPIYPHPLPIQMAHVNQWFHAISESTRTAILTLLSQRERYVSEIQRILGAPQSSVSYHLKVLRESGLVHARRVGRRRYFALQPETLESMTTFSRVVGPGKHVGTCPLTCCQD
jgi:ArsR family transcriptional regulator, arsenate/arsenite/antimonite-responsive transcriptional repressor